MQAPWPAWSKHESIPTGWDVRFVVWGYDERCYRPPPAILHYISLYFVGFPILLDSQLWGALTQKLMGFIATSVYWEIWEVYKTTPKRNEYIGR